MQMTTVFNKTVNALKRPDSTVTGETSITSRDRVIVCWSSCVICRSWPHHPCWCHDGPASPTPADCWRCGSRSSGRHPTRAWGIARRRDSPACADRTNTGSPADQRTSQPLCTYYKFITTTIRQPRREYIHHRWHFALGAYVAITTKPVHWLQICPIVHN